MHVSILRCMCMCDHSLIFSNAHSPSSSPGYGFCLLSIDLTSDVDLSTKVLHYLTQFGQQFGQKFCQGCCCLPFASDTHLHRSVQGCCCIQGLLWCTRCNLLGICVTIPSFMLLKGYSHFCIARCCRQNFSDDYYPNYMY